MGNDMDQVDRVSSGDGNEKNGSKKCSEDEDEDDGSNKCGEDGGEDVMGREILVATRISLEITMTMNLEGMTMREGMEKGVVVLSRLE